MTTTHFRAAAFVAASTLALAGQAMAEPPQISAFARLPAIDDADISPNGGRLATLTTTAGGQRLVNITQLDTGKLATVPMGDIKTRSIRFAGDDYVLAHTSLLVDNVDPRNIFQFQRHLVIDYNGQVLTRLLNGVDVGQFYTNLPVLGVQHEEKPTAVVQGFEIASSAMTNNKDSRLNKSSDVINPVLWKVDVKTGRGRIFETGVANTDFWRVDAKGEPRLRYDANETSGIYTLYGKSKAGGGWKQLFESRDSLAIGDTLLGYSDPDDSVYLLQTGADGNSALVRRSLADGSVTPVPMTNRGLAVGLVWDEYTNAPVAIETANEKAEYQWLDGDLAKAHAKLSRALKGQQVTLYDWSRDKSKIVVKAETPDSPPAWYLLDNAAGQLSPIGESYPELAGAQLGTTSWITYKARDGLEIPAYLTLPPGSAGRKAPLVVLPHGGPASRDDYEFDFLTQFLASRGYAVLRPQFRGSSGFGVAFEKAGHREWAGKMQTDLIDGINHVAAQGAIDPARVCIVGVSYGGYAAMAAAAFNPKSYRCAISINGVSDLPSMMGEYRTSYEAQNSGLTYWRKVLGRETGAEGAALAAASPMRNVDKVSIPLLLMHGKEDTVVVYAQSVNMQAAMLAAGKPVDLRTLSGDDHHLSSAATRTAVLEGIEAFLARHNPAS